MQAVYPKKNPLPSWDPVRIEYPVRQFPETPASSERIGRQWRGEPEIVKSLKPPLEEIKRYHNDYNVTKELTRSQSTLDFGFKHSEPKRFNKHTSCTENQYVYPPSRKVESNPPPCFAHGTSEMRSNYTEPTISSRLVTDKDQFKLPTFLPKDPPEADPSFYKEVESIDTTHDGFEKLLDPYLTTSRLHHRPYTADQLAKQSNSKDIVTYYTYADITWTRTPAPQIGEWRLPLKKTKAIYDREKFKEGFREIRTHNKLNWVPGSFRTEASDNYVPPISQPTAKIRNRSEDVESYYRHQSADLPTNSHFEHSTIKNAYRTEYSHVGSGSAVCSVLDQYFPKNKRQELRNARTAEV